MCKLPVPANCVRFKKNSNTKFFRGILNSAWIKDWEHPLMNKVTRRVYLVTGLKAIQPKEAEDYQVCRGALPLHVLISW